MFSYWFIYRVAKKKRNTYDQWCQENEGQNKQAVSIIAYKKKFISKMTPRSFFTKAFWLIPPFEAMSFSKICHFCHKSHNWHSNIFHCLAPPGKVSALALKSEPFTWMKRSIHYVILQCLQSGEGTQKKFLPTTIVNFDTKDANFENDIASEKWL